MTTGYDVPAQRLIEALTAELRKMEAIKAEEWMQFVKTGRHREKAPVVPDWWYRRVAAVLRKVYIMGPIGTSRLAAEFGGSSDRGSKPNAAVKGSGSITRVALQQLEKAGLVQRQKNQGRIVTPKGRAFVDDTAHSVFLEMSKSSPELEKYRSRVKVESET
ncbi:MAG: 30S ribosomal protein S19e [Thermoplasmata archaeon]|uniref:Small ribosomal subunit protein eS19 n=1 Tax=Candidatus Sysuiplasma superficiale TaxID=2823368 RepID=A0A8J8CC87_9ARCH|nr:30S ribosomal protein S19e [Candidatus Sysuiplasma superficiale]MBX8643339.1 30S ribosomal protein S19e [Candidatus Sysuiplasma superficiale]MCL4346486.1 30S ribosomal protein S19e [Candidatus Thermoplasmatota archaeon]MCL5437391.1 30S ribosomal protein S19e [Candidatus Thermoplasmatota archaeon]